MQRIGRLRKAKSYGGGIYKAESECGKEGWPCLSQGGLTKEMMPEPSFRGCFSWIGKEGEGISRRRKQEHMQRHA